MRKYDSPLLRPPKNKSKKTRGVDTAKELKEKQREMDLIDNDELDMINPQDDSIDEPIDEDIDSLPPEEDLE